MASKFLGLRFSAHSNLKKFLRILVVEVERYRLVHTNNKLATSILWFLQNNWVTQSVHNLESLCEPDYSSLSERVGAEFN